MKKAAITACAIADSQIIMDIETEIAENKGKIRMNELRVKALISILSKEGIVTAEEVEKELGEQIKIKEDD